jgi:sec-independent protein translocase protein TatA
MFGLGWTEILVILLLVFIVFGGGKRMADLGKGLGEGIRNFKDALKGTTSDPHKDQVEKPKDDLEKKS